ncbi:putative membrane protein [Burkholderia sp. MSHR3999]|nr:putative membrane protein [Burkholderia sp. MSHR3999]
MRRVSKTWLYIVFFAPLAFFYEPVKRYLGGGWLFFVCAVGYLCVCSLLANYFGKPDRK